MEFTITVEVPAELLIGDSYDEKQEEFVRVLNEDWSNSHDPILCFATAEQEPLIGQTLNKCPLCQLEQYDMMTHDERATYRPLNVDGATVLAVGCENHVRMIRDAVNPQK